MTTILWFLLILNICIGVVGQILMKHALQIAPIDFNNIGPSFINLLFSWRLIIAILCYFINLVLYLFLLSRLNLGYIFTMQVSLAIIAVTLLGVLLFGESISTKIIIGIMLIISGIIMLNL